jgi:hypothetical protein
LLISWKKKLHVSVKATEDFGKAIGVIDSVND